VRTHFAISPTIPRAGSTGYFALNLPDAGKAAEIRQPCRKCRQALERAAALTRNTRERAISSSPAPHPARLTQLTLGKNNKRLIPQRCRPISRRRKLQLPHWRKQLRHRPRCKQLPANTSISDMENLALP